MMQISELLAERRRCGALVTGESLGQVASQTMESLAYTDGSVDLPVFRPLIGMDKEEIIKLCRKIGSYDTAVEPFEDCCTLFSPDKPLTRPDVALERGVYQGIEDLEFLMEEALKSAERIDFDSHGRQKVKSVK
jgi:thiamine biosynthesis protein ThiI